MSGLPGDLDARLSRAVRQFWSQRGRQTRSQGKGGGELDRGDRRAVTGGRHLDGFRELIASVLAETGLPPETIHWRRRTELPGWYRPEKSWDLLLVVDERLIAIVEFKSQVGSFGNNFNNRTEEAIGTALDLWTAYREGAFGKQPRPFVGWMMMVEDAPGSRRPVRDSSPHFPVFDDFKEASYLKRYDVLCQRLVQEQLYTTASVIASERNAVTTGKFSDLSSMTSLKTFITTLAGHVAAEAARLG